jgi:transcriptional regulator with XRE-family HTH domain
MQTFGELLEELRRSRKLAQSKLAEALGWKQSKVSYLEASAEVPKEDDLRAVCDFFGVRPEYFYDRRENKTPKAVEYLRRLRDERPEASPKAAIAFYSNITELSKQAQTRAIKIVDRAVHRRKKKTK